LLGRSIVAVQGRRQHRVALDIPQQRAFRWSDASRRAIDRREFTVNPPRSLRRGMARGA
jgi:hypothetical protein